MNFALLWLAALPVSGPASGTLVVIGGGAIGPEIVSKLVTLAGGPSVPWVVIPTAGERETYDAKSVEGGFLTKAGVTDIAVLHTRDRKIADTEEFVAPLKRARGVFFPGGRQWRLVDSYLGTRTQREIEAVLERGGVVGGTSAGATILGSYLVRGAREGNTIMMAPGYERGFGMLSPVAIDQHLLARKRENDMFPVLDKHPELLGLGIDESTAIVVAKNQFEVIGPSKVAVYEAGKAYYFLASGDKFDLARRAPVVAQTQASAARTIPPIPKYEVKRAKSRIAIDGKLDDAAWQGAQAVEFLFPWDFQKGAKQKTAAKVLWDDEFLYVGYDCEDADIVAHFDKRDDPTYRDDAVEIFINPNPANPYYYGLEMNAKAVLYDYLAGPSLHLNHTDFQGVQLATHLRGTLNQTGDKDAGWSLELAIPWSNFWDMQKKIPPPPGATWTVNLNRWDGVEPNRRLSMWSDSGTPNPTPHNNARFGQLVFVKD
jgi:cyanophycinase